MIRAALVIALLSLTGLAACGVDGAPIRPGAEQTGQ